MNCPNCNEPLEPTRETRTTTGVTARFACPCGLAFNAYRAAYSDTWTVSLKLAAGQPAARQMDRTAARRAMIEMALEDVQLLGRLGVETEQLRQQVISAKDSNNGDRSPRQKPKTNREPGHSQRQWASGGLNRKSGRSPAGHPSRGRTNGAD